jgi:arylsulfatase A-like enzyme
MKNIILVDVDALMPSRLGYSGNLNSAAPTLNKLANLSLNCTNAFSMGNPTEFALPGLFASAYLLDANGYRHGISDNETTFAEVLKKHGYVTSAFMTAFRPKLDQYERGFDNFYNLIDIQVTEKNLMNTGNWYKEQYNSRNSIISRDECIKDFIEYYKEYLNDMQLYCNNWESYNKDLVVPKSSIFNNVAYSAVRKEIVRDEKIFLSDEYDYITKYFNGGALGITKISKIVKLDRDDTITPTLMDIRVRLKLLINVFFIWRKSTSLRSAKNIVGFVLSMVRNGRKSTLTRYPSGQYILNTFSNWVREKYNGKKPFFTYMKLMDVHEMNIYSHDVQCNDTNKDECLTLSSFFKDVKNDKQYSGNALYDCAIRYNDEIIKKLLAFLKEEKLLDNTIIVITADHGGQFPNLPVRDNQKHRVESFVDELFRIPLMFYNKDIKAQEYKELVSSVDINTTLLEMVGIKAPSSFRGGSILSNNFMRDYVMTENQGRGPCHLKYKSIRVCVRSKFQKVVYELQPYGQSKGSVIGAFDLIIDPNEFNNLSSDQKFLEKCHTLIEVARNRAEEILS